MRSHQILLCVLLMATLPLVISKEVRAQDQQIHSKLLELIEQSNAEHAIWSVSIRDTLGREVFAHESKKLIAPASNLKLLSSAAFLHYLGPDFRFNTRLFGQGSLKGTTWDGDLILVGDGDPSLDDVLYENRPFYPFERILNQLYEIGIERLNGSLVGNDALFDQEPYPKGWSWDDLSFYYGVEIGALSFNRNTVDLTVRADGDIGETPSISWFPMNTDYVSFINQQTITPPNTEYDEYYRRQLGTNTIILRSTLPQGYLEEEELSVTAPALYTVDTFKKYAEQNGFTVEGNVRSESMDRDWESGQYDLLATHTSKPLRELLKQVNKESDNFYVEMLVKKIAQEHLGVEGNTEDGLKLIKNFAAHAGLDTAGVYMKDGSGMAAGNIMTTANFTRLLEYMYHSQYQNDYLSSLSVGREDGTLQYRFANSPLKGNFKGKSGYIGGVRTLSGYMVTNNGTPLIVSLATNHYTNKTSEIDRIHEQFLNWVYNNVSP